MESKVAKQWLETLAETANSKNYAAHMDLISKNVQVFGVPGFAVIDYNDWANQCKYEFEQGVLKRVSYQGMKVITMTPGNIMFKTIETVESSEGTIHSAGVEILLKKEEDDKWRVVQERILTQAEMDFDQRKH